MRQKLTDLCEDRADSVRKMEALAEKAKRDGLSENGKGAAARLERRFNALDKEIAELEAAEGLPSSSLADKGSDERLEAIGRRPADWSMRRRMLPESAPRGVMDDDRGNVRPSGDVRAQALTVNEQSNTMPDDVRQKMALAVERDPDPDSRLARWIVAAGDPAYMRAFRKILRDPQNGHRLWTAEELAAAQRVNDEARVLGLGSQGGGTMVPYAVDPQILISNAGSVDPMRRLARVVQTTLNEQRFVTSAGAVASWDPESQEVSDDSPTLTGPAIVCHKGQTWVETSWEHADDSVIAEQVAEVLLDSKIQLEASAFTLGTGTGQPKGVITAVSAVGGSVVSTGTNVLAQADLYNNQAALPARWRANAKFCMNLSILNGYRQLPQATGLNYSIINDDGPVPKALGWEVHENSAMDGTLGAGADYTVLSGDFRQYAIVDRVGAQIEYVPHTFGANGRPKSNVGWLLRWRTGGDVLIPDAFRLTSHST